MYVANGVTLTEQNDEFINSRFVKKLMSGLILCMLIVLIIRNLAIEF